MDELTFANDHRQLAIGILEGFKLVPDFVETEDLGGVRGEGDAVVVADDFGGFEVAEFAGSAFGRGGADEFAGGDFVVLPPPGFGFAQELALFDRGAFAAFPADDEEASAVRGGQGFADGFKPGSEFPGAGVGIIGIKNAPDGFLRSEAVHVFGDVLDDAAFGEALGDVFFEGFGEVTEGPFAVGAGLEEIPEFLLQEGLLVGFEGAFDEEFPDGSIIVRQVVAGEAEDAGVEGVVQVGDVADFGFGADAGVAVVVEVVGIQHGWIGGGERAEQIP